MNVLVTGGAGYIGSTLIKQLLEKEHKVVSIDNLSRGDYKFLMKYKENPRLKLLIGDIRDPDKLKAVIKENKDVGAIVHFAAIPGMERCQKNPKGAALTNIYGTYNVLETARNYDIKVVFISSAAVYGNPIEVPISENHSTNPTNLYGVTKLAGEKLLSAYHSSYKLNTVALRFGNVYGFGVYSHWETVIPKFTKQALSEQPLTIYGNGEQSRDFIHVWDIIQAIELVLEGEKNLVAGETFNVGTGKPISVNTIANMVTKIFYEECKKNVKTTHLPPRKGEPDTPNFCLSPIKIKNKLEFRPQWDIKSGIKQLIRYS
ncbi:GDP-mannose 4,6-dehydratase [Candidatus Bathyarchaeota archaeon]|nr:GDP-mannose 4,6-dehydratase [Candidatus Bathyarchaeota archaeon]